MAERRPPARELNAISILWDDFSDTEIPRRPGSRNNVSRKMVFGKVPHPAMTDFGLDTLSKFLYRKTKEHGLREETLKNNPYLASAEAEKRELRSIVNSNASINAIVREGRLEAHECKPTQNGHDSAPPSEGDSESQPKRARGRSFGVGSREKNIMRRKSSSSGGFASQPASMSRAQAFMSSNVPVNTIAVGTSFNDDQGQSDPANTRNIVFSQDSQPDAASFGRAQFRGSVDNGHRRLHNPRISTPDLSSNSVDSPQSQPSCFTYPATGTSSGIGLTRDDSSNTDQHVLCLTAQNRSRSFERHADEVRQSLRFTQTETEQTSSFDTDAKMSRDKCPNNAVVCQNSSDSCVNDAALASSTPSNFQALHSNARSTQLPLSAPIEMLRDWTISEVAGHFKDNSDTVALASTSTSASATGESISANTVDESDQYASRSSESVIDQANPKNVARYRADPTGQDTFYSATSDENGIECEKEEDTQTKDAVEDIVMSEHVQDNEICDVSGSVVTVFDYNTILPEQLPPDMQQARVNCKKIWALVGHDENGRPDSLRSSAWLNTQYTMDELDPEKENILGAPNAFGEYPRTWKVRGIPRSTHEPPICPATLPRDSFPLEILPIVCRYLSSQEVRTLRLVNRATASAVVPLMIRSSTFKFGPSLFQAVDGQLWDEKSDDPAATSILQVYGDEINKFGIAFEFDSMGLANAKAKIIEEEVDAWFGKYTWPKGVYPNFPPLKAIEDLVDGNRPLLRNSMKALTNVNELALSVDSGHGWLNGPDISDLQLFKIRQEGASPVCGKTFDAPDKWNDFSLRQYFRWAQKNTLHAYAKSLADIRGEHALKTSDKKYLKRFRIRNYDDFQTQSTQPDFNRAAHTGGTAPALIPPQHPVAAAMGGFVPPLVAPAAALPNGNNAIMGNMLANGIAHQVPNAFTFGMGWGPGNPPTAVQLANLGPFPQQLLPPQFAALNAMPQIPRPLAQPRFSHVRADKRRFLRGDADQPPIIPQWPLIFNGYNLAAQTGGNTSFVQDQVSRPSSFPYMPGDLIETQVQWLMETVWAQRAFLSAYTSSIITNTGVFKMVHTLNIAKLSSGLISSIAQDEFWSALPGLKKLVLKISPDWRQEHVPGDRDFQRHMLLSPLQASLKLADLLETRIAKLENLSTLITGFIGGGEHQTGLFARNGNVLPAPITHDPHAWLSDHENQPDTQTMFTFNHIRNLTFENCWFSPCMLEAFMQKSRDTSLHHLTLDSVSLTGVHDTRNDGPLTTVGHYLTCRFAPSEWMHEEIPGSACWVNVLDKITPGRNILDQKYDADMIDEEANPKPEPEFRGNIRKISLISCGYVKVSGVRPEHFGQNGLVVQGGPITITDIGLQMRKRLFYQSKNLPSSSNGTNGGGRQFYVSTRYASGDKSSMEKCIMQSTKDGETGLEYFGLGTLTQCVHPIEKRVLERAWGLRFGWGDTNERWAAVEDGFYEGGTGRFSGTILRHDNE